MPPQFLISHFLALPVFGQVFRVLCELFCEVFHAENIAQIAVGKDGICGIGLVDGFQQHPIAYETMFVRLSRSIVPTVKIYLQRG